MSDKQALLALLNTQRALRDAAVLTREDSIDRSEIDKQQDEHIRLAFILLDQLTTLVLATYGAQPLEKGQVA